MPKLRRPYLGAGITYFLRDLFTDTNGTNLTAHTMNVGPGWTNITGLGTWTISSNQAVQSANDNRHYRITSQSNQSDGVVSVAVTYPGSGEAAPVVPVRVVDNNNLWYCIVDRNASAFRIRELNAGTDTIRATGTHTIAAGSTETLTVNLSGATITFTAGGDTLSYGSATFQQTATLHGIGEYRDVNYGANSFDNFQMVPL